jgi:flagella basal body P-ring formation protein FlgA
MRFGFLVLALTCSQAWSAVMIRVRPHVVVKPGTEVHLSQLMDTEGLSQESQKKIAAISVSKAPEYGEKQEISSANIVEILREIVQKERARSPESVHLVLPKTVIIDTIKRELSADLIGDELMEAWQPLCADCKLEIEALSPPVISGVRDWTLKIKPELPKGSFSIPVEIVRENGSPISAWVSGRLVTKRKVPVAKRMIGANERLLASDFTWEYRDTSYALDTIPSQDEITGKRLKQALRASDILWRNQLEREKAVHRGEVVQLKSGAADWEVSLSVVAQQDGYIGDIINFKNPKTNNMLVGEVVGQDEVVLR